MVQKKSAVVEVLSQKIIAKEGVRKVKAFVDGRTVVDMKRERVRVRVRQVVR